MDIDPGRLPPQLRALIKAVGPAAAVRLLRVLGGQRVRIAQNAAECASLAGILLPHEIESLCTLWGGRRLELPKHDKLVEQLRNTAIRADTRTLREIARDYGLTRRWVIAIRSGTDGPDGPEPECRQRDLFKEAAC